MGLLGGLSDLFGGQATDYYSGIQAPDPATMKLALQQYVQQGIMTPQDAQAVLQDPSKMSQIATDPAFKQAQVQALSGLENVANQGGLTAIDKAQLNDIANQENTQARGAREAVQQNAEQRGVGGSGLEILGKLMGAQGAASDQSNRDTSVAANAQQRALDALIQGGQMGSQMQGQQFGQQAQQAEAQDRINQFNAMNQNQMGLYNMQAKNAAQYSNLANKQGIANQNTGLMNQQQMYNKGLPEQNFQNQLQLAGAKSGALNQDKGYNQYGWNQVGNSLGNVFAGGSSFF